MVTSRVLATGVSISGTRMPTVICSNPARAACGAWLDSGGAFSPASRSSMP